MLYTITLTCPHCRCAMPGAVVAEVEPPPDAVFTIRCPLHDGPYRIRFQFFKKVDELPSGAHPMHYPPKPEPQPTPFPEPERNWWLFWKR